jgi:hypothetical protein
MVEGDGKPGQQRAVMGEIILAILQGVIELLIVGTGRLVFSLFRRNRKDGPGEIPMLLLGMASWAVLGFGLYWIFS